MVPDQKEEDGEIRIALCSLYLLFGIAMICMSFNLVQVQVINNVKTIGKQLGIIKDDEDEEDYWWWTKISVFYMLYFFRISVLQVNAMGPKIPTEMNNVNSEYIAISWVGWLPAATDWVRMTGNIWQTMMAAVKMMLWSSKSFFSWPSASFWKLSDPAARGYDEYTTTIKLYICVKLTSAWRFFESHHFLKLLLWF